MGFTDALYCACSEVGRSSRRGVAGTPSLFRVQSIPVTCHNLLSSFSVECVNLWPRRAMRRNVFAFAKVGQPFGAVLGT